MLDRGPAARRRVAIGGTVLLLAGLALTAPTRATAQSPRAVVHDVGQHAWEPTLGFTKSGALMFAALAVGTGNPLPPTEVRRSRDGGRTWSTVSPAPAGQSHAMSGDPYLYVDPSTSRTFVADFVPGTCSEISFSDDDGETWTTTVGGCGLQDKQTLFAGPPVSSKPDGYPNVVYYCAATGNPRLFATLTGCQKSLDGGLTWIQVGVPYYSDPATGDGAYHIPGLCNGHTGHGFVGQDGTVYLPKGHCGQPWLAISRDEGLTWERVQVAANGMSLGDGGLLEYPWSGWYAEEANVQADADGNLYYTWVARDLLPYLAVSRDGGRTWSKPIRISPPGVREASLPNIVVGKPGRLAIAYVASTNAPGASRPVFPDCVVGAGVDCETPAARYADATWNGYVTMTTTALHKTPRFVTAVAGTAADPLEKGPCGQVRCGELGDFFDVVLAPDGTPWAAFVDNCLAAACPAGDAKRGIAVEVVGGPALL